ncbi:MAG: hypothetical protein Hyperionvirus33_6 [Hyperionvirus sp.]|uniref:Uncharacterized protein n=1 Tax=Hyperionvirus sp. TaxID=2487770 RepID=A0A3G5AFJ9_9VIRU|nr:MAG: hypothetical protein Hyperionvirus33_6 [Hyperionvirus sp.]
MSSEGRQESIRATRHELAPFFGNHGGAELFIKLFIEPTGANGYDHSINETNADDLGKNEYAYALQFLKAESYGRRAASTPSTGAPAQYISDNDVHPQFADFLIQVALFHRLIDEPAQAVTPAPATQRPSSPTDETATLWNDVFLNWRNLTESARTFYKKYLQFMVQGPGGAWREITDYGDQTVLTQPRRINLLKVTAGTGPRTVNISGTPLAAAAPCPKFINLIPKVPISRVGKVWYTNANNNETAIDTPSESTFKMLYCSVYKVGTAFSLDGAAININPIWNPQSKFAYFNINVDKYTRKRFFKISAEMKKKPKIEGPLFSLADKNVWHVDENNKLYKEEGGTKVYYDENSAATEKLMTVNFKCYSTFAKLDDGDCERYVNQCLLRSDPESLAICADYWKKKDFYDASKDEIKQMHPVVAARTLEKFGFRVKVFEDTECKMPIKKFETVEHWVGNVLSKDEWKKPDKNGVTLQKTIEENEKLLNYLKLLVEYINANPAILNGKAFASKTAEAAGRVQQSRLGANLKIQMAQVPAASSAGMYDSYMLQAQVRNFSPQAPRQPLVASFGGPNYRAPFLSSDLDMAVPFQLGGGEPDINSYMRRIDTNVISGANALQALIDSNITDLQNMGITIDGDDKTTILMKIDNMKKIEEELVRTAMILGACKYLLYLFPGQKSEMLSYEKIKAFVEKYKDLVSTQYSEESALVKIQGSLTKLLAGQADDFVDEGYEAPSLGFGATDKPQPTSSFFSLSKQAQKPPCF